MVNLDVSRKKEFSEILTDYDFFKNNCNEDQNMLNIFTQELLKLNQLNTSKANNSYNPKVLDFGCGNGTFLKRLISSKLFQNVFSTEIYLVEPDPIYRIEAMKALAHYTYTPLRILNNNLANNNIHYKFDLIISNHVLYYVTDLDATMDSFFKSLAPNGKIIISLAEKNHGLCNLLQSFCDLKGATYPYYIASDLISYLKRNSINYEIFPVLSELRFKNTSENINKIIRFVLSDKYAQLKSDLAINRFIAKYAIEDELVIPLYDIVVSI